MKFISVLFFLLAFSAHAETLTGYVVAIADGDTLTVLVANHQQYKIRLVGIDAPEKSQGFGDRSKQSLASLVFNKNVTVEWSKLDRYGRTVGKIMVNGIDANLEQIKTGMAWWYRAYAKEQSLADRAKYEQAETIAKQQQIGLWRDRNPMPPWDFRHGGAQPVTVSNLCLCRSSIVCTGPKGGSYCITQSGGKSYK